MQALNARPLAGAARLGGAHQLAAAPLLRAAQPSSSSSRVLPARLNVAAQAVEAPAAPAAPARSHAGAAETYAVVEVGGHQLIVEEGRYYTVNRLEAEPGAKIRLGRVLALKSGGAFAVGTPYLAGAVVEAEVLEDLKGPKVVVYKMKPKKHYRRTNGHRQPLTKFLVTKISA